MATRLWDSTGCLRPTSWSDRMRLRSQETTQATDIISNQGVFHTAHVTLCPKPHTDMLSWIPHIPQPVSARRGQATVSIYRSSWGLVFFAPVLHAAWPEEPLRQTYRLRTSTPVTSCPRDTPGPLCVPLSAAGFHFCKQHSSHTDDNSSPIMGVITKRLSVSHCQGCHYRPGKNASSKTYTNYGMLHYTWLWRILKYMCNKRSVGGQGEAKWYDHHGKCDFGLVNY